MNRTLWTVYFLAHFWPLKDSMGEKRIKDVAEWFAEMAEKEFGDCKEFLEICDK